MKELIRVRVQYALRQQCCKTHKRPLPYLYLLYCIVASNRIYDQPYDGLEKGPKHVVAPKIRYVNNAT